MLFDRMKAVSRLMQLTLAIIFLQGCAGGAHKPPVSEEPTYSEYEFPRSKEAQREVKLGKFFAELAKKSLLDGNQFDGFKYTREATKSFEAALGYAPGDPQIQIYLGVQYFNTGSHEKAISMFDQAIVTLKKMGIKELQLEAMLNRLNTLFTVSNVDEAFDSSEEILKIDPYNKTAESIRQWCIEMKRPKVPQ